MPREAGGVVGGLTLFQTVRRGMWPTSSSASTLSTAAIWERAMGWLTSTTCSSSDASLISSRVARKAAICTPKRQTAGQNLAPAWRLTRIIWDDMLDPAGISLRSEATCF